MQSIRSLSNLLHIVACLSLCFAPGLNKNKGRNPLLLVMLDGFRWDFMDKAQTPNLHQVARQGVRARHMIPVNPTLTLPNHQSIMTGLWPESHGMVSNNFYDPCIKEKFLYGTESFSCPKWWCNAEPIWLTNQKQGGVSAMYLWPGEDGYEIKPCYRPPSAHFAMCPFSDRIDVAVKHLMSEKPPNFTALYFEEPDITVHKYGPNANQTKKVIEMVDKKIVGYLLYKLQSNDLLDKVNLVIISDHGHAATAPDREIYLDNFLNEDSYWVSEGGPVSHIWPAKHSLGEEIYTNLTKASKKHPCMKVYKKGDLPEDFHLKKSPRVSPVVVVMDPGWYVYRCPWKRDYFSYGSHGYTNKDPSMWATFLARGPAFREGVVIKPLRNIDLYPVMCELLGIKPRPNNGTLDSSLKDALKEPFTFS